MALFAIIFAVWKIITLMSTLCIVPIGELEIASPP